MNKRCCKYCKKLIVNIVEPSDIQLCVEYNKQVRKMDYCDEYVFDEKRVKYWGDIEDEFLDEYLGSFELEVMKLKK